MRVTGRAGGPGFWAGARDCRPGFWAGLSTADRFVTIRACNYRVRVLVLKQGALVFLACVHVR